MNLSIQSSRVSIKIFLFAAVILSFFPHPAFALHLDGISYEKSNPAESIAVMDGNFLKAGDKIGEFQVEAVLPSEVHLKNLETGETKVLKIDDIANSMPSSKKALKLPNVSLGQGKSAPPTADEIKRTKKNVNYLQSVQTQLAAYFDQFSNLSGPFPVYKKFSTFIFEGKFDEAKALAKGTALESIKGKKQAFSVCVGQFEGKRFSAASYQLISHEKSKDKAELEILQTARGDPPGVTSVFGSAQVKFRHKATLLKEGKDWKVSSFTFHSEDAPDYFGWLCYD